MTAWQHILTLAFVITALAPPPTGTPPVGTPPTTPAAPTAPAPSVDESAPNEPASDGEWKPFVIPAGQEGSVTRLLEPYWSHPQNGVTIASASVDKTFVQIGVKLGNATRTLYLMSPDDHATEIDHEAKPIGANGAMAILSRCEGCTADETRTLKMVADGILTNQQQNNTQLWKAIPRPRNTNSHRTPWRSQALGWILVALAIIAGIGLRIVSRRKAAGSSAPPSPPNIDKPTGSGTN